MSVQSIGGLSLDQVESFVERQKSDNLVRIPSERLNDVLQSAHAELQAYQQNIAADTRVATIAFKASILTGAVALIGISSIPFAITSVIAAVYFASSCYASNLANRYVDAVEALAFESAEAGVGALVYQKREYQIQLMLPQEGTAFLPKFISKTSVTQLGKMGSRNYAIFQDVEGRRAITQ